MGARAANVAIAGGNIFIPNVFGYKNKTLIPFFIKYFRLFSQKAPSNYFLFYKLQYFSNILSSSPKLIHFPYDLKLYRKVCSLILLTFIDGHRDSEYDSSTGSAHICITVKPLSKASITEDVPPKRFDCSLLHQQKIDRYIL